MKDCNVCAGFRSSVSYCPSLKEHLNKTAVSKEVGRRAQNMCSWGCLYTYMRIRVCTTPLVQQPGPSSSPGSSPACIKCWVIHKAGWWSRGRGRERGSQGGYTFSWVDPLGRPGGFGLSGHHGFRNSVFNMTALESGWGRGRPTHPYLPSRQLRENFRLLAGLEFTRQAGQGAGLC